MIHPISACLLVKLKKMTQVQLFFRDLRYHLRSFGVLLYESRIPIILFLSTLFLGAFILFLFYQNPFTGEGISFSRAFFSAFSLIFFETTIEYPTQFGLQVLFFLLPILGLASIADGLLQFGVLLVNRKARGQKWQEAMAKTTKKHIIICGFGKVGYRTAQELLKFNQQVIVIEIDGNARFLDKTHDMKIPFIHADATHPETLLKANIKQAEAIIPCTENELTNLKIALEAHELNPDIRIVLRLFDFELAEKVGKSFGITRAISTSALTAPMFATAAMGMDVKNSFYVKNTLLNLVEFTINEGSSLAGYSLARLSTELDVSIVHYQFKNMVDMHPDQELILQPEATILVLCSSQQLKTISQMNQAHCVL